LDAHALPERDVPGDRLRGVLRLCVEPRGFLVHPAVDDDVVVAGGALPPADARVGAGAEALAFERAGREVVVAFDDDRLVALREHCAVPSGPDHVFVSSATRRKIEAVSSWAYHRSTRTRARVQES